MTAEGVVSVTTNDLLIAASLGLILLAAILWRLFYLHDVPTRREPLSDGAVLLISDGLIERISGTAANLLGECENRPVMRTLDGFLDDADGAVRQAIERLELTGEPVKLLVRAQDGRAFELIGEPSGGVIRIVLRDADFLDSKLRDAQERLSAADLALKTRRWEEETLRGLIADAPIIAWHRTAKGEVNWAGGEIRVRDTSVTAEQAVSLIVARTKLNRQPVIAGQPQKSRIEIVVDDGADTVSLHVFEIIKQDGGRIGFATDAGTTATAERTLTRFVQTMTETFAHLTVGLAIFDRNQTLALFNPALVQMWQVEPAWLARRPSLRDIIDELRTTRRLPEHQDFHQWRTRILSLFENTEAADYEELWHLADGSNIRVLARPHPHGSLAFIFDDVTERVRLEQRYRHSIDLRRATLDHVSEGIAVFGANGLLQFVNEAFHGIWGSDNEVVHPSMHARQLVRMCEDLTVEDDCWDRLLNFITGEEDRRAWSAQPLMGSGRQLDLNVAPLPDGSTIMVVRDGVASVLSGPLPVDAQSGGIASAVPARAAGGVESLLAQIHGTASQLAISKDTKALMRGTAQSLSEMTEELSRLLSAAHAEPGARVDTLAQALPATVERLRPRATARRIEVRADPGLADTLVHAGQWRLRQVVYNLGAEAIRHAADGSEVTIGAEGQGDRFSVIVTAARIRPDSLPDEQAAYVEIARRFARPDGGRVEIHADFANEAMRIVCGFDADRAQTATEDPKTLGDNIEHLPTSRLG